MKTELELRKIFRNLSDCYADTRRFENDGSHSEGEVIEAMTEDRFIEALKEAKLLSQTVVIKSVCEHINTTKIRFGISDSICDDCGERIKQTVL
ncbi:MAG: hypothetical protein WD512_01480 [Candidatus Paceibacterota bacterium]